MKNRLRSLLHDVPVQFITAAKAADTQAVNDMQQQIIWRCGGQPWAVDTNVKNTLVIAVDANINSEFKKKTLGGFIAFHADGKKFNCLHTQQLSQDGKDALLSSLVACTKEVLKKYKEKYGDYPSTIIHMRNGLTKAQLKKMVQIEAESVLDAVASIPNYKPKMVVVQSSKCDEVFFDKNHNNPVPGSLITAVATSQRYLKEEIKFIDEFFLISHFPPTGIKGFVEPTRYLVYKNEAMSEDELRLLMWKWCHLRFSCATTAKAPAPCLYAQKLALITH